MMTGDSFIALVGKLAAGGAGDEATCRTSISRAYYGAFHLVRQYLVSLGLKLGRDHGELQRSLMQSGDAVAREAGGYLVDLHSSRIKADYDLANRDVADFRFAQECVELACDIRTLLGELDGETHRIQVKSGIEQYRRKISR